MKTLRAIQMVGLIVVFIVLGVGYIYFQEQSLLGKGRIQADNAIEEIAASNHAVLKQQLYQINGVGEEQLDELRSLRRAIQNIDYIRTIYMNGNQATFFDHFIENRANGQLYRAVYEIPGAADGKDYVVMVFSRKDDGWQLSDVVLSAVNPIL